MFIVREIFHLKFGQFRPVKALLEEMIQKGMSPKTTFNRILSDFTGQSYRIIMELGFDTLADYEQELGNELAKPEFQDWYKKFITHVDRGEREILKVIF